MANVVVVATEGTAGMVVVAAVVMEAVSAVLAAVTAEAEVDSDQNMMIYCKKKNIYLHFTTKSSTFVAEFKETG